LKRLVLFLDGERETTIKLLGVDHDRALVEMLTAWFQPPGYEVPRASRGKQALGAWQEHQADLIIVDTLVQDVATLTLCRERRSHPRCAGDRGERGKRGPR
jgi:DNA-binding response OmpR family regulator